MSNFTIEEFKSYKVTIHCCKHTDGCEYHVILNLKKGTVSLKFVAGRLKKNKCTTKGKKKNYEIYYAADRYPHVIDILRNEKPLYFYFNDDTKHSYVTTSDEPVGENE